VNPENSFAQWRQIMRRIIGNITTLIVVLSAVLIITTGCGLSKYMSETARLESVEVREYQSEKLSSINDFQENSIKGPQRVNMDSYRLKISGLVENPREYSYDRVINSHQNYEKVVTLDCVEGWSVTILWKGLLIRDFLAEAKPSPDAKVVIFHAYDGYTTSLPLDYIVSNDIIIAYKMNGVTLPPERGFPFQLVAESKWGYKWIKWVTEIELSDDVNYRGYWEQRGYSNSADLDEGFFEK
jgi:DMSO/TMAO reductase YedYZ molybdopterin-dependent catalytic subunit